MFRHIAAVLLVSAMIVVIGFPSAGTTPDPIQTRGCCSHHGGVAGTCCGRTLRCNDGSCSPTCGC